MCVCVWLRLHSIWPDKDWLGSADDRDTWRNLEKWFVEAHRGRASGNQLALEDESPTVAIPLRVLPTAVMHPRLPWEPFEQPVDS